MASTLPDETQKRAFIALVIAAAITVLLFVIPYGHYVIYPLMLFSTFAHEFGHGLSAWLMGGEFLYFRIWPDGSGVAAHRGHYGDFSKAFISAGGLVGPAVLAGIYFLIGRREELSRVGLYALGAFSILGFFQSLRGDAPEMAFGIVFCLLLAVLCIAIARLAPASIAQIVLIFLAVQLSLSVFSRGDYLFMEYAQTAGGKAPSDVTQISNAIGGPYWLWGGMVGLFSVAVLAGGIYLFFKSVRSSSPTAP